MIMIFLLSFINMQKSIYLYIVMVTAASVFFCLYTSNERDGYTTQYEENYLLNDYLNYTKSNYKYILLWVGGEKAPLYYMGRARKMFSSNKCLYKNCYVTSNRNHFGGNLSKFHAIAFNGRGMSAYDLPKERAPHQKYIYFNMESADNYPVCDKEFDNFFNWTATYKLDSDIPYAYFWIRNSRGDIVGPRLDMQWPNDFPKTHASIARKLKSKSKPIAWFVSHCTSRSNRSAKVTDLQKELDAYRYYVDIYGSCGLFTCARDYSKVCNKLLEKDYYFYLSYENSLVEDYVTEKVVTALENNVVPIVYGGANYSRFLPPGSYLDAGKMTAEALAVVIDKAINIPQIYQKFFRWKPFYKYSDSEKENMCKVCEALNDERYEQYSLYKDFRQWWLPNYLERCELTPEG